ncbi:SDR family NAD(P)-dependent oxidoreductase [Dactylosporangium cerinum]|uniref:SDR family NAD(P)-dependent oxidoreductase n=1 Tax=Dactylosporangium cerinum TaxID=1434730 RepID=A0ABV9VSZ2_9ACTN
MTGASSGIGRASALAFADRRDHLVLSARSARAPAEVAEECRARGAVVQVVTADVTVPATVAALAEAAVDAPKRVAATIVRCALRPRTAVSVGRANPLFQLGFVAFPRVYDWLVGPLMRRAAFSREPMEPHEGNVFAADAGDALHGQWLNQTREGMENICRSHATPTPIDSASNAGEPGDTKDGRRTLMGLDNKIDNKAQETTGKVKEGLGKATDDDQLEAEGKTDQASGSLKQAGEKIKDVFKG